MIDDALKLLFGALVSLVIYLLGAAQRDRINEKLDALARAQNKGGSTDGQDHPSPVKFSSL